MAACRLRIASTINISLEIDRIDRIFQDFQDLRILLNLEKSC
jgi:hypothetical protein